MRALTVCVLLAASVGVALAATLSVPGHAVEYEVLSEGLGARVTKGDDVLVHAKGVVAATSKTFWDTHDKDSPFGYKAGVGGVIVGWDQGLLGAKLGETRKLHIPAHEGYGAKGFPAWGIPANGDLEFTIEVLKINGVEAEGAAEL